MADETEQKKDLEEPTDQEIGEILGDVIPAEVPVAPEVTDGSTPPPAEDTEDEGTPAETESEPEPEAKVDPLAEMRAKLEELAQKLEDKELPEIPKEEPADTGYQQLPDIKFVEDDKLDEVVTDPKEFNALLNKLVNVVRETTLRDVVPTVNRIAAQTFLVYSKATQFYAQNPDLVEDADLIRRVGMKVQADNPNMTLNDLYDKVEQEVRRIKNKPKPTAKPAAIPAKRGAFAPQTGVRRPQATDKRTTAQREMDELLNL